METGLKLPIVEIFDSISGEINGYQGIGQPSTFIRLQGCNLSCRWCDTLYAQGNDYREMTLEEIVREVSLPHVTITGGEPLRHQLGPLMKMLELEEKEITLETNGSYIIPSDLQDCKFITVMDFKLPSSQMMDKMIGSAFQSLRPQDWVKFVCEDPYDFQHAVQVIATWVISANHIAFSPIIDTHVDDSLSFSCALLQELLEWIATVNPRYYIHFSVQLHKLLGVR